MNSHLNVSAVWLKLKVYVGRVVRRSVNASAELKINRSIDFYCKKMFFTADVLCSSRLFKLETER